MACLDRRLLPNSASASESCKRPRRPKGQHRAKRSRILLARLSATRSFGVFCQDKKREALAGSRISSAGVEFCTLFSPERDEQECAEDEGAQGQPEPGRHDSVVDRGGAGARVRVCSWVCHPLRGLPTSVGRPDRDSE